jgi:hypothetical protein
MLFRHRRSVPACLILGALASSTFAPCARAQDGPLSFDALACMSWDQLDALYRQAEPGSPPAGFVRGRTIYNPHGALPEARGRIANTFWKGKHFFPECDLLVNQWLGMRAIRARTSVGESWLDGKPAQVLDYADTSWLWRDVRDEMREVAPGLYVGAMYLRRCPEPRLKTMFVLDACRGCE